tara:strand:+ start:807 stop:968 length:162 start_codon:yes stop_codon:yes gene_type:complete
MKEYKVFETVTFVHYVQAESEEQAIDKVCESGSQGKLLYGSDWEVWDTEKGEV